MSAASANLRRRSHANMDMTSGVIWRQLAGFSVPIFVGFLFQQLYSTVDSVVVGNFVGADALGAVSGTTVIVSALISLLMGIANGANVTVAQDFGAHRDDQVAKSVHTSFVFTTILSLAFAVAGFLLTPLMLVATNIDEQIMDDAVAYLQIYCVGIPALMIYDVGSGILRAVGDSRKPIYILAVSSVMNIALDLLFVIVFDWKIAGAGWATVVSELVSAIAVAVILLRSKESYGLSLSKMGIDRKKLKKICSIGIPSGVQMAIISLSNIFVQAYINAHGAAATTGWGIYSRLDGFIWLPIQALCLALTTFVGQNSGARRFDRIKQGTRTCMKITLVLTIVVSAATVAAAQPLSELFNRDEQVLYYSTLFIRVNCSLDVLNVVNNVLQSSLQGMGDTRAPMIAGIMSFVVFRQIYLAIVSRLTDSVIPIALGYPAGWLLCSTVMIIYWRHSHHVRRLVASEKR